MQIGIVIKVDYADVENKDSVINDLEDNINRFVGDGGLNTDVISSVESWDVTVVDYDAMEEGVRQWLACPGNKDAKSLIRTMYQFMGHAAPDVFNEE